tara:strand:+ start:111 stop:629 length:519 start_codon:yes stop_codon:yes gene_type:complete
MSGQGNKKNVRGESFQRNNKLKRQKKEEERLSKFSPEYHKEMEKRHKRDNRTNRRTKELTPAQKRFKEREAKGLSGLTGGKKGETIAEYRTRQKDRIQKSAGNRNADYQAYKKGKMSLSDFIKKHPTSNTARKAKDKKSSVSRKLKKESLKLQTKPKSKSERTKRSSYWAGT